MQPLTNTYDFEQKRKLTDALIKLFSFQAMKKTDDDVVVWVNEICSWGYSIEFVMEGMRKLHDVDFKPLKLAHIREAAREVVISRNTDTEIYTRNNDYFESEEYRDQRAVIEPLKLKYGKDWWKYLAGALMDYAKNKRADGYQPQPDYGDAIEP